MIVKRYGQVIRLTYLKLHILLQTELSCVYHGGECTQFAFWITVRVVCDLMPVRHRLARLDGVDPVSNSAHNSNLRRNLNGNRMHTPSHDIRCRSKERRVGKECVIKCGTRGSRNN